LTGAGRGDKGHFSVYDWNKDGMIDRIELEGAVLGYLKDIKEKRQDIKEKRQDIKEKRQDIKEKRRRVVKETESKSRSPSLQKNHASQSPPPNPPQNKKKEMRIPEAEGYGHARPWMRRMREVNLNPHSKGL